MIPKAFKKGQPASDKMLCLATQLPINVITPRIGELVKKGLVIESHRGREIFWKIRKEVEL